MHDVWFFLPEVMVEIDSYSVKIDSRFNNILKKEYIRP